MKISYKGIFTISEQINIIRSINVGPLFDEAIITKLKNNSIQVVLKKNEKKGEIQC